MAELKGAPNFINYLKDFGSVHVYDPYLISGGRRYFPYKNYELSVDGQEVGNYIEIFYKNKNPRMQWTRIKLQRFISSRNCCVRALRGKDLIYRRRAKKRIDVHTKIPFP